MINRISGCTILATLLTFGICGASLGAKSQAIETLNKAHVQVKPGVTEDFANEFDKVWQNVRDHFWDSKLNGVDWSKIGSIYKARLAKVKSKLEFEHLINAMLSELHSSHTAYITDDDYEFYMLPAVMQRDMENHKASHIGVTGHDTPDGYLVAAIMDAGPAVKAGILAGDVLVKADGERFSTAGSFKGKEGKTVRLDILRNGAPLTINVVPVLQNLLTAFLNATRASARVFTVDNKKIAYLHLWTMANDNFKGAMDDLVVSMLHDSDGMILDLRDGFGGTPYGYMDVFSRPDTAVITQYRGSRQSTTYTGYNKPLVVLINSGTRSAKEFFSFQFKSSRRATLVGTQTAGAFLGAGSFPISDFGVLEMAIVGLTVDGVKLEANGMKPDIEVAVQFPYTDKDTQFAVAQSTLLSQIFAHSK